MRCISAGAARSCAASAPNYPRFGITHHFFRVQRRLEEIVGCRVDLVMREAVKPQLRERILAEAVRAA
jgi:predicted nucleotidyltransferase